MRPTGLTIGVVIFAQLLCWVAVAAPGVRQLDFAANEAAPTNGQEATRIGRCGAYVAIDGLAKIVRVDETAASAAQATAAGGPGYAGYEVWFSFTPNEPVSDAETSAWIAKEHELRLANSWYPGPRFVEKYGLEAGATIPAVLKVQKAGPCTPFVLMFPGVDTADYFESER